MILDVQEDFGNKRPKNFNFKQFLAYCFSSFGKNTEAIALYTGITKEEYYSFTDILYNYKKYLFFGILTIIVLSVASLYFLNEYGCSMMVIITDVLLLGLYRVIINFIGNILDGLLFHAMNKGYVKCNEYY